MLQEVSWEAAWERLLGIGIWVKMLQGKGAWRGRMLGVGRASWEAGGWERQGCRGAGTAQQPL